MFDSPTLVPCVLYHSCGAALTVLGRVTDFEDCRDFRKYGPRAEKLVSVPHELSSDKSFLRKRFFYVSFHKVEFLNVHRLKRFP